jgi:predicted house-cleaning noncanonical NTP pyrophosphatase (MazG superfamily)
MPNEKLIRDSIVTSADFSGKFRIAEQFEMPQLLLDKLREEMHEVAIEVNKNDTAALTEELADVLEVVRAIADYHDICLTQIQTVAEEKRKARGGFNLGVVLNLDTPRKSS